MKVSNAEREGQKGKLNLEMESNANDSKGKTGANEETSLWNWINFHLGVACTKNFVIFISFFSHKWTIIRNLRFLRVLIFVICNVETGLKWKLNTFSRTRNAPRTQRKGHQMIYLMKLVHFSSCYHFHSGHPWQKFPTLCFQKASGVI